MNTNVVRRTYLISGLDRRLYRVPPTWSEGTFEQYVESEGRLILTFQEINSENALISTRDTSDRIAERFRLAVSKRIARPLRSVLESSEEPELDGGTMRVTAHAGVSASLGITVFPNDPPCEIEQLPEDAARWVATLAETASFGPYPEEILRRFHLLIEELKAEFQQQLDPALRQQLRELRWLRNFVSHAVCDDRDLCAFIGSHLPSAILADHPLRVRFDRTSIEHKNLIGRYDPIARRIALTLLDAAIAKLD